MNDPTGPADVRQRLVNELTELTARLERVRAELLAWQPEANPPSSASGNAVAGVDADPRQPSAAAGGRAAQPYPAQPYPAQPYPAQPYPAQPYPGQPYPGQPYPGQPYPGQPYPGQAHPARPYPAQAHPAQARPAAATQAGHGAAPAGLELPAPPPGPGQAPRGPRPARLSTGRVLAWVGGGITLLGVVLLLVLAAARGWFGPESRVIAGAVLGLALVGIGVRVHRKPEGTTGALALVGTGVAALYLDVAAATALYEFLLLPIGLLVAFGVAAGGLWLADRWKSELLAVGAVLGAAVLAPVLTGAFDWRLVALILALQLAALPVVWRRAWRWLAMSTAGAAVLYGTAAAAWSALLGEEAATAGALGGVLLVGVATAVLTAQRLPVVQHTWSLVAAALPVLIMAGVLDRWPGTAVAGGVAVLLGATAAVRRLPSAARIGALVAAAVAAFVATVIALDGATLTVVLLGEAVVLAVVAAVTRGRMPLVVAGGYATVGLAIALSRDIPPTALAAAARRPFVLDGLLQQSALLAGAGVSALVLAAAIWLLVAAARVGWIRADSFSAALWAPIGAVGLYGAAGLVITLAVLGLGSETGFLVGHAVVTVSWTVLALVLLARGIDRPALRIAGTVLVAAAVAKLILFDLIALDGLARVVAFLGAGLVLLAAGSRYARLVSRAKESEVAS